MHSGVEIVEHAQRCDIELLRGLAHGSTEVAHRKIDVRASVDCGVEQRAADALVSLQELRVNIGRILRRGVEHELWQVGASRNSARRVCLQRVRRAERGGRDATRSVGVHELLDVRRLPQVNAFLVVALDLDAE